MSPLSHSTLSNGRNPPIRDRGNQHRGDAQSEHETTKIGRAYLRCQSESCDYLVHLGQERLGLVS
jgi:hypothetical protein